MKDLSLFSFFGVSAMYRKSYEGTVTFFLCEKKKSNQKKKQNRVGKYLHDADFNDLHIVLSADKTI
jgi:hypothetical protein